MYTRMCLVCFRLNVCFLAKQEELPTHRLLGLSRTGARFDKDLQFTVQFLRALVVSLR